MGISMETGVAGQKQKPGQLVRKTRGPGAMGGEGEQPRARLLTTGAPGIVLARAVAHFLYERPQPARALA